MHLRLCLARRPHMVEFVGVDALDGLRGASADGGTWEIRRN
ncbi:hypothetical protein [Streptomyces sp. NPDC057582]